MEKPWKESYQQTKTAKVEQTCVLENNRTVVKTLGCIFVYKGYDTLFLHPGTYTIWNQQVDGTGIGVICRVNFFLSFLMNFAR
ncbi:unnamed protein product [Gongylonema pulchrum]|uniref:ZP domain-containing protein n=1 Tax=Gongylonema pulchrum TaxID=637853 RepID=A0A183ESN4_9BILA|nr:unnamed protein product [Gongylonema pulchrum]